MAQPGGNVDMNDYTPQGGGVSTQVIVYGPDGKAYPSPAAAQAAGVPYSFQPPGTDMSGFPQLGTEVIDQAKIEPVIAQQDAIDYMADPLLRQLYFGSEDTPGFLSQVQKATQQSLGQDVPVQQFADFSDAEQRALQSAVSGIGGFQPFLDVTQKSIQDAITREQQAGTTMDPYFQQAETQLGIGS